METKLYTHERLEQIIIVHHKSLQNWWERNLYEGFSNGGFRTTPFGKGSKRSFLVSFTSLLSLDCPSISIYGLLTRPKHDLPQNERKAIEELKTKQKTSRQGENNCHYEQDRQNKRGTDATRCHGR